MDTGLISLLIIEDDAAMLDAFVEMVHSHPHLRLLGTAGTLDHARQFLRLHEPDVVLLDLDLPDGDGLELIAELATEQPATAVLVSTVFGDEAHVVRAIEAGARGYLLKDTSLEEFSRAIETVRSGGAPLSPHIARHLLNRLASGARAPQAERADPPGPLTTREIQILTRISQGFTIVETASQLHISSHTVNTHIKNIYIKLAVRNRVQAVNLARRWGFIR